MDKPDKGKPSVRALIYLAPEVNGNSSLTFVDSSNATVLSITVNSSVFTHSKPKQFDKPDTYSVFLDEYLLKKDVPFRLGGAYTVVGSYLPSLQEITGEIITVTQPNSLHMAYMLPQYIIITMAEVMFSITGLQFAFTQAPESMKSLLQAGWLLSVAFGNLIVVIIKGSRPFERQVSGSRPIMRAQFSRIPCPVHLLSTTLTIQSILEFQFDDLCFVEIYATMDFVSRNKFHDFNFRSYTGFFHQLKSLSNRFY